MAACQGGEEKHVEGERIYMWGTEVEWRGEETGGSASRRVVGGRGGFYERYLLMWQGYIYWLPK